MPNHKRAPISTMGTWDDVTLHDISDITSSEEYEDTRRHALRLDSMFETIDYRVYTLLDRGNAPADVAMRHVVFDAAYETSREIDANGATTLEATYRESVFSLIVDRVVARHIDPALIYLATVVCGNNITTDNVVYTMQPALHLIVDRAVDHDALIAMVTDIYDYMAVHGYVITGESSDFLINLK